MMLGVGAVVGLILFANLLSWLLKKYHDITIALLVGFMIGSLSKIWPWKETLETIMVEGKLKPLVEKNVLPVPGSADDKFALALLMMAAGIGIILLIELILPKTRKQ
jgi:putative membrane protein